MIVVDNSILVAALLKPGHGSSAALAVLDRSDLVAPELLDVEATHAVRGLLLAGKISRSIADRFMAELPALAIERVPHRALLARMWELRDNLTAYDAAYIALAELLDAGLVTGDRAMLNAPGIRCAVELIS